MAHSKSLVDTTTVPEDDLGIFSGFNIIGGGTEEGIEEDIEEGIEENEDPK